MTRLPNDQGLPAAVVLGLSPTGLYAIRELGRRGIRVIGASDSRNAAAASTYLRGVIVEADARQRLGRLVDFARAEPAKPVMIPTSDQDVEFIIENATALQAHFVFQGSYADGKAARILAKDSFYALCAEMDVAFPAVRTGTAEALLGQAEQIGFPAMVKPSVIHEIKGEMAGKKGWIVRDVSEFRAALGKVPEGAGTLICQDIVAGPESEITLFCAYFDGKGGVHQPFTSRKLRQYPPGFGSASMVQSSEEEDTFAIATGLLKGIGYEGIAAAELKRDPASGELRMIEINPRPSLWFSASEAAGKTVTLAAYAALTGQDLGLGEEPQRQGVRWRYRGKDLYSAIFYRLKRDFLLEPPDPEAVGPAVERTYPVYSADDPRPALAEIAALLKKGVSRLGGRLRGR